jgi:hypothetical protein
VHSWIIEAYEIAEQLFLKASQMVKAYLANRCYWPVDPGHAHGPAVSRRIDRFLRWHWLAGEVAPAQEERRGSWGAGSLVVARPEDPLTNLDLAYSFGEICFGDVGPRLVTEARVGVEPALEEEAAETWMGPAARSSSEYPVRGDQPS